MKSREAVTSPYWTHAPCDAWKALSISEVPVCIPTTDHSQSGDSVYDLKTWVKLRFSRFYQFLSFWLGQTCFRIHWPSLRPYFNFLVESRLHADTVAIQLGSGNQRIAKRILNIDLLPYPEVDLVCDAGALPFRDCSVDLVLSHAFLEHVPDPDRVIAEAARVLKTGGTILTAIPFIEGFHASPYDFTRWTVPGARVLHERHGFREVEVIPLSGPTSSLIWILAEWIAIAFSFGISPLYRLLLPIAHLLVLPLKFLDLLLIYHSRQNVIASFFVVIGKKSS